MTTDPATRLRETTVRISVGSVMTALLLGLLTSPMLIVSTKISPVATGYAVAGVISLAVVLTVSVVQSDTTESPEFGWIAENAVLIVSVVYYNAIILAAIFVGLIGGGSIGLAAATLYPILDYEVLDHGIPLSLSGLFAIALVVIMGASELAQSITWQDIRPEPPLFRQGSLIRRR